MFNKIPIIQALKEDRWVKPFLKRYKKTLVLAISLGILTFVCAAGLMFCAGFLISKSATKPENILLVYVPIVLTRAFGIGRPALQYLERLASHNWVFQMTSKFRQNLYDALEVDATKFNSKYQLGDILGLLSDDVSHIQNLYLRSIFPIFVAWGLYAIIVVALGFLTPLMGLWMLLVFGIMIFAIPIWSIIVNGSKQSFEKEARDRLYVDLTDNVMGVSDWVLSGRSQEFLKLHVDNQAKMVEVQQQIKSFERKRNFIVQMFYLLVIVSLIIWGAGKFAHATNWIAAFVLAVFPLNEAIAGLPAAGQETNVYEKSLRRLNKLKTEKITNNEKIQIEAPYNLLLKDVHYTYPKTDKEVLSGINLKIVAGEKIAILGQSGAGKSTLASLLRGDRLPSQGSISLNGIPTAKFGDQIANYFSVINQKPYLFNTTIANNLRLGNETASDEQIWDALDRVGLLEMVKKLPQKLDTKVDEAGLRFSGGERHRLALARILLQDAPIVLLDEPTVGLDSVTEQAVIDTFNQQLVGKTMIWITHHLQGIDKMDQVLFIEHGQIVIQGSPNELWENSSRFRELKKADQGL